MDPNFLKTSLHVVLSWTVITILIIIEEVKDIIVSGEQVGTLKVILESR